MAKIDNGSVTVIGAGYVGLPTAVLFAEAGYRVYIVDTDQQKLRTLKKGESYFYEAGINPLLSHSLKAGRLIVGSSYRDSVAKSSFVFSCVGTPENPDGSTNLEYVFAAATEAIKFMKPGTIFVQKSTVPVGTGKKIEHLFAKANLQASYVSNPEFLREGTSITDTLWFDRVVVGSRSRSAAGKVAGLYKNLESQRDKIAARANLTGKEDIYLGEYFVTNRNSAELIKVTANAFLALKISFANSIAKFADHTNADINEVMDVVGADRRIGHSFLNAGRGYGGGCFPKDVSGLISSASEHGVELQLMTAATELNASMPGYIANKARAHLGKIDEKKVAVLGLSYKAGTSDARKSPGVKLANILANNGASVSVYDPKANGEARDNLRRDIKICSNLEDAVKNTDAVFITTEWPEFIGYDLKKLKSMMKGDLLVDCMNEFSIDEVEQAGLQYIGVGRKGDRK